MVSTQVLLGGHRSALAAVPELCAAERGGNAHASICALPQACARARDRRGRRSPRGRITRVMRDDEHGVVVGRVVRPTTPSTARPPTGLRRLGRTCSGPLPQRRRSRPIPRGRVCSRSPRLPAGRGLGARRPVEPPSRGASLRPRRAGSHRSGSGRRRNRPARSRCDTEACSSCLLSSRRTRASIGAIG